MVGTRYQCIICKQNGKQDLFSDKPWCDKIQIRWLRTQDKGDKLFADQTFEDLPDALHALRVFRNGKCSLGTGWIVADCNALESKRVVLIDERSF